MTSFPVPVAWACCLVVVVSMTTCWAQSYNTRRNSNNRRYNYSPNNNNNDGWDDLVVGTLADELGRYEDPRQADVGQMLQDLQMTSLIYQLDRLGLTNALRQGGPYTVFGPTNEAFDRLSPWTQRRLQNDTVMTRTLQYHVADSRLEMATLEDEMLVDSLLGKPVRINLFPKRREPTLYTANCVPIVDSLTSPSAVVHKVGRVLLPPYGDLMTSLDACPVFTNLTAAMRMVGLANILTGPVTLFAPSDYVFQRAFPNGLDGLFRNRTAVRELVYSHVVRGTHCAASLDGGRLRTLSGRILMPMLNEAGAMTIDGVRVSSSDAMVTDGVVHCVQQPLWP